MCRFAEKWMAYFRRQGIILIRRGSGPYGSVFGPNLRHVLIRTRTCKSTLINSVILQQWLAKITKAPTVAAREILLGVKIPPSRLGYPVVPPVRGPHLMHLLST